MPGTKKDLGMWQSSLCDLSPRLSGLVQTKPLLWTCLSAKGRVCLSVHVFWNHLECFLKCSSWALVKPTELKSLDGRRLRKLDFDKHGHSTQSEKAFMVLDLLRFFSGPELTFANPFLAAGGPSMSFTPTASGTAQICGWLFSS